MIVWSHTTFLSLPFLPFSSPLFSLLGIEIPTGSELDRPGGIHYCSVPPNRAWRARRQLIRIGAKSCDVANICY